MSQVQQVLTILFVTDLDRMTEFLDEVFGWPKTVDEPVYVEYELGTSRIGVMPQSHTRHFLGEGIGGKGYTDASARAELYLVFDTAALDIDRLHALAAPCTSQFQERGWGDRAAYFLIPDGYVVAVAERL